MSGSSTSHPTLLVKLLSDELQVKPKQIADFELCVCDTQPGCRGGALNEFIFSARLDNLCMSFCALYGLINGSEALIKNDTKIGLIALFDNEEIGSQSAYGAASNMMLSALNRIAKAVHVKEGGSPAVDVEGRTEREYVNSFLISADMAHAVHPNYGSRHDDNHQPNIHSGPVVKYNASQKYATTSITAFLFKELCRRAGVPVQEFVVRNDSPCGSTIGPILSSSCGIRTVDVGVPQLSMHSIREMCGVDDVHHACKVFKDFFEKFTDLDESLKVDAVNIKK